MPTVTTKLDKTKHDIRNGSNTGSPVSKIPFLSIRLNNSQSSHTRMQRRVQNLLGVPQITVHLHLPPLLVARDERASLLKPLCINKQRPAKH